MTAILIRCSIASLLGAAPGLAWSYFGTFEQGLGLTVLGGVLGLLLALSGVLYKSSALESFKTGGLLALRMLAGKNIPFGDHLVPVPEKEIEHKRPVHRADPNQLEQRSCAGWKWGIFLSAVPAVLLARLIPLKGNGPPYPQAVGVMMHGTIALGITLFGGGIVGGVIGQLTLRGVHRRNIVLGTGIGCLIGMGTATALLNSVNISPWTLYACFGGFFPWLGMFFGSAADFDDPKKQFVAPPEPIEEHKGEEIDTARRPKSDRAGKAT